MAINLMKELQRMNNAFLNEDNTLKCEYPEIYNQLDEKRISFLRNLISILMTSEKILCSETKYLIKHIGYNTRECAEMYAEEMAKMHRSVKVNTYMSKVYYDKNKIEKLLDGTRVLEMILTGSRPHIETYEARLYEAMNKEARSFPLRKEIILNLPNKMNTSCKNSDTFNHILKVIEPYTKKYIEEHVYSQLSSEEIGYLNYLTNDIVHKNGVDLIRKNKLLKLLGLSTDEEQSTSEQESEAEEVSRPIESEVKEAEEISKPVESEAEEEEWESVDDIVETKSDINVPVEEETKPLDDTFKPAKLEDVRRYKDRLRKYFTEGYQPNWSRDPNLIINGYYYFYRGLLRGNEDYGQILKYNPKTEYSQLITLPIIDMYEKYFKK